MKTILLKAAAVFCVLVLATTIMMDSLHTEFGRIDFFHKHGLFFLIFITLFPRLTLLFSSVASGGLLWWLGFIFCPRILVASLATVSYFQTNPFLVVMSWVIALGGETMEKIGLGGRKRFFFRTFRSAPPQQYEEDQAARGVVNDQDVIEAEFVKKT
jgi:hypothetical protein